MSCLPDTGIEVWILDERYVVTAEMVGLPAGIVEMLEGYEPEEQRRLVEALLFGRTETTTSGGVLSTVFRSLDGGNRIRFTLATDETGRTTTHIGDLT